MDLSIQLVFCAGLLLTIKHFFGDGPLQTDYQYKNKGKWLHPDGLLHAGIHGVGTFLAILLTFVFVETGKPMWYLGSFAALIAVGDFIIHYLIDLTKIKATEKYGWTEFGEIGVGKTRKKALIIHNNKYFWAIMADQAAHFLTYIIIICLVLAVGLQQTGF